MKRLQAYKFRIEPNGEQQRAMRRIAGSCRFVWNRALALQIANHEAGEKFINHFAMCKWLPVWKKEPDTLWLKELRLPTLWTNSYFVSTIGGAPLEVVKQYIEQQKHK